MDQEAPCKGAPVDHVPMSALHYAGLVVRLCHTSDFMSPQRKLCAAQVMAAWEEAKFEDGPAPAARKGAAMGSTGGRFAVLFGGKATAEDGVETLFDETLLMEAMGGGVLRIHPLAVGAQKPAGRTNAMFQVLSHCCSPAVGSMHLRKLHVDLHSDRAGSMPPFVSQGRHASVVDPCRQEPSFSDAPKFVNNNESAVQQIIARHCSKPDQY